MDPQTHQQQELYHQQQASLLKLKQKYENRSEHVIALKNPILFFMKTIPHPEKQPYLYWYAYSIGRIKNIFWGIYKTRNHKFVLVGSCHFNHLSPLNETLAYKKGLGFNLVSTSAKNRIDKRINQWLPEDLQFESTINRTDMSVKYATNQFLTKINDEFLDYVERNSTLLTNATQLCLQKENCFNQQDLALFGNEGCDQFCYGDSDCLYHKDTPDLR